MEYKGKIVDSKENKDRTTYILQLEHALSVAGQDNKILQTIIEQQQKEICELKIKIAKLELL